MRTDEQEKDKMIFGFDPNEVKKQLKQEDIYERETIEVTVVWKKTGDILPVSFIWQEKEYKIDKILECRKGMSLKTQISGYRYRCKVGRRICYLYYDNKYWHMEIPKF